MSVYGFSDNKCRVPVTKQQEFEQFKDEINANFGTSQEENNDFLVKKMCLLHYGTTQPVVKAKYKSNTSITKYPDTEYIETRFVEDFSEMFSGATALTSVSDLDTKNAKNMFNTFYNCKNLTSIPDLDTSNVTDMTGTFANCANLTSIPDLDTSNVTNMFNTFYNCKNLTSIPDLDTSNVTDMTGTFASCTSLTTLRDNPLAPVGSRWQFKDKVAFNNCPLDRSSILKVFNGLQTVTDKTIFISSTTNGYLSEEDKAIATSKGWTVQVT